MLSKGRILLWYVHEGMKWCGTVTGMDTEKLILLKYVIGIEDV